jgi:hypothetical protein
MLPTPGRRAFSALPVGGSALEEWINDPQLGVEQWSLNGIDYDRSRHVIYTVNQRASQLFRIAIEPGWQCWRDNPHSNLARTAPARWLESDWTGYSGRFRRWRRWNGCDIS